MRASFFALSALALAVPALAGPAVNKHVVIARPSDDFTNPRFRNTFNQSNQTNHTTTTIPVRPTPDPNARATTGRNGTASGGVVIIQGNPQYTGAAGTNGTNGTSSRGTAYQNGTAV